jgi:hypothetical protein
VTQALAVLSIAMLCPLLIVWLWHRCVEARAQEDDAPSPVAPNRSSETNAA